MTTPALTCPCGFFTKIRLQSGVKENNDLVNTIFVLNLQKILSGSQIQDEYLLRSTANNKRRKKVSNEKFSRNKKPLQSRDSNFA